MANAALAGRENYREIQQTLGNFYEQDGEKEALRREIRKLREKASAATDEGTNTTVNQLALIEKSYQMAAKYLPQTMPPKPIDTSKAAPSKAVVRASLYRRKANRFCALPRAGRCSFCTKCFAGTPCPPV